MFKKLKRFVDRGAGIGALARTPVGRSTIGGGLINSVFNPKRGGGQSFEDPMVRAQNEARDASQRQDEMNLVGTGFNNQSLMGRDSAIKYDSAGRPIRSSYLSITDQDGKLRDQFSMQNKIGADIQLNQSGLNEIRNRALSQGPSAWANLANQQQGMQEQQALQQSNVQGQAGLRQNLSQLAGRGGVSAGARERLAMQGMRGQNQGMQGVLNQGMQNRMNINLQDQQSKDQMLTQLPGMDMQAANFAQQQRDYRANAGAQDIGNALKDIGGYNAYRADAFGKAMQEWGTDKTANAQVAASKRSGKK